MIDSRERFTDRVENYTRFRPGYPDDLVTALFADPADGATAVIADIGSGSGIFTRKLLERGARVYAVEPNAAMRIAAERDLREYDNFVSIDGDAGDTGLGENSVDLITAAQAFHWFNNLETLAEFQRILRPGGRLALIWNKRRLNRPFQKVYDTILREYAPEYGKVNHMNLTDGEIAGFFADGKMRLSRFDYMQRLDFASLLGRLQSSSYCPRHDTPAYRRLRLAMHELFEKHARGGMVDFDYDSLLYLGEIAR